MSDEANNPGSAEAEPQELAPEADAPGADQTLDTGTADGDNPDEGHEDEGADDNADDFEEIEHDGQKFSVPKALKEAFLRQQDYTQKTQTLAEQRRQVEAHREALEQERAQQAETVKALRDEVVKVGTLETRLAAFKDVDWRAAQQQIAQIHDPQARFEAQSQYTLAWSEFTALEREVSQAKQSLTQKEQDFASQQTQRVQAAVTQTLQSLAQEDPSFNIDTAQAAIRHAMDNYGLTQAEATQMADKRVWKLMLSDKTKTDELAKLKAENAKLRGQRTAQSNNEAAQQVKPAVRIGGKAAPPSGLDDRLSADEWVKRRNAQVAKRQAAR